MSGFDLAQSAIGPTAVVFLRLGGAFIMLPGFGEMEVNPQVRLGLALLVSLLLTPVLAASLPALPDEPARLAFLVGTELALGLAMGTAARLFMAALSVAGTLLAMITGLAASTFYDPQESGQRTVLATFLTVTALPLVFITDAHQTMLVGLAQSYRQLPPGMPLPVGDLTEVLTRLTGAVVATGLQIAMPGVVLSILTNLCFGVLNRLMPALQAMVVAVPVQVLTLLAITGLTLAATLEQALRLLERGVAWW